jgi:hypothetical protein
VSSDALIAEAVQDQRNAARLLVKAAHEANPAERSRLITLAYLYAGMGDKAESLGMREMARETQQAERSPRR